MQSASEADLDKLVDLVRMFACGRDAIDGGVWTGLVAGRATLCGGGTSDCDCGRERKVDACVCATW